MSNKMYGKCIIKNFFEFLKLNQLYKLNLMYSKVVELNEGYHLTVNYFLIN